MQKQPTTPRPASPSPRAPVRAATPARGAPPASGPTRGPEHVAAIVARVCRALGIAHQAREGE